MRIGDSIRRFGSDRSGNIGPLMVLMTVPVLGIASMAIDLGRAMNTRTTMQAAADIAALTGVRSASATETERIAAAQAAFAANLGSQNADPTNVTPSVTYTNGVVTVSASGSVKTTLAQLLGLSNLSFTVESSASIASGKQLELSMMIDLTGSMGEYRNGQTKIAGLKEAANDMLGILFPNNAPTSSNVRVAIAPFADYVNAGEYADNATGLNSSGGTYTPISNLSRTRQGKTSHARYTGYTANTIGSQCGATSASGILNASGTSTATSINTSGGTFNNAYCATPTYSSTADIYKTGSNNYEWGQKITVQSLSYNCNSYGNNCSNTSYTGEIPGFKKASNSSQIYDIDSWQSGYWYNNGRYSSGYFLPLLNDDSGLTMTEYTHDYCNDYNRFGNTDGYCNSWVRGKKGKVGAAISYNSYSAPSQVVKRADQMSEGGYWRVTQIATTGSGGTTGYAFVYQWTTNGRFIPLYDALSVNGTYAGCESTSVAPSASNQLISCVTERIGTDAYTDTDPTTSPVGAFNHYNNGIDNYSSDGMCWVAGRELPKIVPLTNTKATLTDFFANATVGGATPGHIGTAWAWYMLSPKWKNVFTTGQPAEYSTPNVLKVAVLMTDGEYNVHYASATAREQALALCTNMKAAGITIYTVGFGFSATSNAGDSNAEGQAKDLLTKCASDNNKYFFPYDGAAMRTAFQNIGNSLMGALTTTTAKITN